MKAQFAKGLFIKNDDNGNPCHVGDIVKVSVEEGESLYNDWEDGYTRILPAESFIGTLVLLKTKGVSIRRNDGSYIFPALTKNSIRKWKWELVMKNENKEFFIGFFKWNMKRLAHIEPKEFTRSEAIKEIIKIKNPYKFSETYLNEISNKELFYLLLLLNIHEKPIIID